jgi:enoyl-CoA hydratase
MQRGIALVRMSKPPVNAMDIELAAGLGGALNGLASEEGVRAVVLAGLEGCFSAGLDLKALPHLNAAEQKELLLTFGRMILDLYRFPRPVIAAVDGHAIAGGRIGGDGDYQLGLTEVRVGVPFPIAPLRLVQAELGPDVARRLVLTSRTAGPREALEWGALDELRPPGEVEARALEIAEELAALPSISYTRTKHLLREETIGQMEDAVDQQLDPALSGWLTPESASAAARVLGQD